MKLKKLIAAVLVLVVVLTLSTAALACGHHCGGSRRAVTHVCADADWDGWCDSCGAACAHSSYGHHGHRGHC